MMTRRRWRSSRRSPRNWRRPPSAGTAIVLPYEEMELIWTLACSRSPFRGRTAARRCARKRRADHRRPFPRGRFDRSDPAKSLLHAGSPSTPGSEVRNVSSTIGCGRASASATRPPRPGPRQRTTMRPARPARPHLSLDGASSIRPASSLPVGSRLSPMTRTTSVPSLRATGDRGLMIVDDWSGWAARTAQARRSCRTVPSIPFASLVQSVVRPSHLHGAIRRDDARCGRTGNCRGGRRRHGRLRPDLARPWKDAGVERASDDPYLVAAAGELKIEFDVSSASLARAGAFVDRAQADPSVETVAAASVAVARPKSDRPMRRFSSLPS